MTEKDKYTNKCVCCGTYITDEEKERAASWLMLAAPTYERDEGTICATCKFYRAARDDVAHHVTCPRWEGEVNEEEQDPMEVQYYVPGHIQWEKGETPLCTYCDRQAVYASPVGTILLCEDTECHTEFVKAESYEIELEETRREDHGETDDQCDS